MRHTDPDGHPRTTPPVRGWPTILSGRRAASLLLGPPALLFALITWQVVAHGPLARADERLSDALVHRGAPTQFLADLGSIAVAVPVLAVVLTYVGWRARATGRDHWWRAPVVAALLMAAVPLWVVPLKELVARSGPPVMGPGTGFYPSGHTATAAIAYGAAVLSLLPWLRGALVRRAVVVIALVVNLGVGFGLVRQGYHWPLDVVASWCVCAMLLSSLWSLWFRPGRRSG
ncbi:phosphatase PAP2 family protein [Streptomyces ipomoeae]|uniref:PAP2 family protein n=1 Tax=Streptomyces ipomoeae 91-03 TaxID=698759 RepID=L1KRC8_9ACTN|nr:phosphatase PAP2 family protein [Streptomyces ipomoeae]EKX63177.1 PAP2 family protein [Streptomyces ipomoeae 91-03]MDX2842810.1 phosphatase PAP2 family protein [Streptomyces ipomoeae]MDX2877232.1 phosphatase PAP2 family protein [Streptomyces ipomoeae]MDX2934313.1 phosphatase PAP2 family protein [Streptomyces ipomoeae]TQE17719.1 phosphatase PAP2 family protein [Streptomyces ipomoeae]